MGPLLEVDGLCVAFPGAGRWPPVVRDLSLRVDRGEALALVGESGCGKSVTALALVGLVPPPGRVVAGEIRLDGERLSGGDGSRWRAARGRRIGFVFQEPGQALDPVFSIGSQLRETIRAHRPPGEAAGRQWVRRRALDLLSRVAIGDPEEALAAFPHQLSGGQRQRATIALALAAGPDLLIADEPTTALDVTIQAQILHLLTRLRRELGLALLLITHDLAVVAEVCDRALVMYAGQAVEEASVDDLYHRPSHPYTRALLAAVPRLGERSRPLATIPGRVPTAGELPTGCAFHPRCPEAVAACGERPPLPVTVGAGHRSRCLLREPPAEAP